MNKQTRVWITFQREGFHQYPAALTDPQLADVKFLGYEHRHIFHFRIEIEVFHDDRDVEFILFKREIEGLFTQDILHINNKSCEMLSDDIAAYIYNNYPDRDFNI